MIGDQDELYISKRLWDGQRIILTNLRRRWHGNHVSRWASRWDPEIRLQGFNGYLGVPRKKWSGISEKRSFSMTRRKVRRRSKALESELCFTNQWMEWLRIRSGSECVERIFEILICGKIKTDRIILRPVSLGGFWTDPGHRTLLQVWLLAKVV